MKVIINRLITLQKNSVKVITGALICFANPALASNELESDSKLEARGKAIFSKYGIDEDLPKLGVSSLAQGEHLVEHILRVVNFDNERSELDGYVVKHTDHNGNIDLRLKYDGKDSYSNENFVEIIENSTRTQYRLRNWAQAYDPASVRVVEHGDSHATVFFNYSKYGLPQDIAYYRHMQVEVKVINGVPQKMNITNRRPFKQDSIDVQQYNQSIRFKQLNSGSLIIDEKHITTIGTKKNRPIEITETIEPIAFYDQDGVNILDERRLAQASDPRLMEEKVKVNSTFPLMGDMVRQQGIDIPLPFGISVAYRNQDMNLATNDFVIGGIRLNEIFDPNDTIATVNAESVSVRGDVNILPFWNMFGFVGKINVDANVDAAYTGKVGEELQDRLNNKLPGLGDKFCEGSASVLCNRGRLDVPLSLEYDAIGVGTTLSVGYREFFASLTGTYTKTRLNGNTDWGDGLVVVQPMLGYQLVDYRTQLFVGAEYQGLKNRMQGHVVTGDIEFDYDVGVDVNNWAGLVGFNKQFGKHYNMSFLYNKGESRDSMTLNLGYRF